MPVAAVMEKLLDAAQNVTDLPNELDIYDLDRHLTIQLRTVPELVRAYNERNSASTIKQVTNLRTLCEMMMSPAAKLCSVKSVLYSIHY